MCICIMLYVLTEMTSVHSMTYRCLTFWLVGRNHSLLCDLFWTCLSFTMMYLLYLFCTWQALNRLVPWRCFLPWLLHNNNGLDANGAILFHPVRYCGSKTCKHWHKRSVLPQRLTVNSVVLEVLYQPWPATKKYEDNLRRKRRQVTKK